jgi:hypothetical protein
MNYFAIFFYSVVSLVLFALLAIGPNNWDVIGLNDAASKLIPKETKAYSECLVNRENWMVEQWGMVYNERRQQDRTRAALNYCDEIFPKSERYIK